jgi:hypothetical protein
VCLQSWPHNHSTMRWTYTFLIATYLLLTAHSTAQPVSSAVQHADTVQLARREPLPARQKRQRSPSPVASGSGSAKRHRNHSPSPGPPSPKKQRRSHKIDINSRLLKLSSKDCRAIATAKEPASDSDWKGYEAGMECSV